MTAKAQSHVRGSIIRFSLVFFLAIAFLSGCAGNSYTAQGAKKGAATGAVSGAVGGLVTALVFGGDPVDHAARGAVYGGAVGATAGAIHGSERDKQARSLQEAGLRQLRQDIGDEAYLGLEALADCDHGLSLGHAEKARKSSNPNHALAGLWLEVLNHADQGNLTRTQELFAEVAEKDWDIDSVSQARSVTSESLKELEEIRGVYGLPRNCSG
jgi:hypothetical protein